MSEEIEDWSETFSFARMFSWTVSLSSMTASLVVMFDQAATTAIASGTPRANTPDATCPTVIVWELKRPRLAGRSDAGACPAATALSSAVSDTRRRIVQFHFEAPTRSSCQEQLLRRQ